MDSEHGARNKNSRGIVAPAKRLESLSSDSSSLSDNSSGDFIQVDPILKNPRVPATVSPNDVGHVRSCYKIDVSSEISSKSGHDSEWSTCGTSSQVSDLTNETLSHSTSLTESPPTQVMERPHGFDHHRIPPSIFTSKPHSPMDWSVASNESLFSIRLGNSSFSRDAVRKLSGELFKSGDLQKNPNLPEFGESHKANGFTPPPTIRGKESERKYVNIGRNFGEIEAAPADKKIKDAPIEIASDHSEELLPVSELSFNNCSDEITTTTDTQTFASPKKKKHARSSWYCSNCSCGFCCPTRPSCCSSVPVRPAAAVSHQVAAVVVGRAAVTVVIGLIAAAVVGQAVAAVVIGRAAAAVVSGQAVATGRASAAVVSGQASAVFVSGRAVVGAVRCQAVPVVAWRSVVVGSLDKKEQVSQRGHIQSKRTGTLASSVAQTLVSGEANASTLQSLLFHALASDKLPPRLIPQSFRPSKHGAKTQILGIVSTVHDFLTNMQRGYLMRLLLH
ncbi:Keratin-associated protein like [Actinidia chinensis var. chinensis]|uniref:Keratin-associated protein like n=1 Tax=Actinidia chinensis var. chinensis TaxID=1590841 RepID=A0A2R6PC85_ACTCC|nr:Keratin-associated protein like [Actinidia chinensis var. chinensis]